MHITFQENNAFLVPGVRVESQIHFQHIYPRLTEEPEAHFFKSAVQFVTSVSGCCSLCSGLALTRNRLPSRVMS